LALDVTVAGRMTRFTTVDAPSHAQEAAIDRLLRLRAALTGMASELASLKREHRHVRQENVTLRRENVRLADENAHLRGREAHIAHGDRQVR
jgi:regulator of replication initiation timing